MSMGLEIQILMEIPMIRTVPDLMDRNLVATGINAPGLQKLNATLPRAQS
jgi:hypothetical protein